MPGKHNAGGCTCCACWECVTAPETVAIAADTSAGACCQYPNGTYTVGAADGVALSRNTWEYDETNHRFIEPSIFFPTAVGCTWTWLYRTTTIDNYACSAGDVVSGTQFEDFVAVCSSPYTYAVDGSGNPTTKATVMLKDWIFHVMWRKTPTVRIKVVVSRVYHDIVCNVSGTSGFTQYRMTVNDEYSIDSLACGSLPASINYSSRWVSFDQTSFSAVTAQIAYVSGTFSACAANASVSLTYV